MVCRSDYKDYTVQAARNVCKISVHGISLEKHVDVFSFELQQLPLCHQTLMLRSVYFKLLARCSCLKSMYVQGSSECIEQSHLVMRVSKLSLQAVRNSDMQVMTVAIFARRLSALLYMLACLENFKCEYLKCHNTIKHLT